MTDQRERIIEAVADEVYGTYARILGGREPEMRLTAATVDTAMLGVCSVCHGTKPRGLYRGAWLDDPPMRERDCPNDAYHTARERMERAE